MARRPQHLPGRCRCGCGRLTAIAERNDKRRGWLKGQPKPYLHGHNQRAPLADRLWAKIDVRGPDECWNWTGADNGHGYGHIGVGGRDGGNDVAHRVAYELTIGPIPPGHSLHHTCENRRCCNPAHLEAVTQAEHSARHMAVAV